MSDDVRTASPAQSADTPESKPEPITNRQDESTSSATRIWAWGRTHEPYDWMDAHTPCDNLSSWH